MGCCDVIINHIRDKTGFCSSCATVLWNFGTIGVLVIIGWSEVGLGACFTLIKSSSMTITTNTAKAQCTIVLLKSLYIGLLPES